jgi:hypothetical protein
MSWISVSASGSLTVSAYASNRCASARNSNHKPPPTVGGVSRHADLLLPPSAAI